MTQGKNVWKTLIVLQKIQNFLSTQEDSSLFAMKMSKVATNAPSAFTMKIVERATDAKTKPIASGWTIEKRRLGLTPQSPWMPPPFCTAFANRLTPRR